ncbi:hypothetical protein DH86_00003403 [Scytalidium sp. 3C]|nr:hypothetical protein DH86_00003403 [Scytalidium sp. 3C]
MVKEFLPAMIEKNHGHVVTMASAAAYIAVAQMVDYSATKAAALAFHEGLTAELKAVFKADKVKTTVITPMWIDTPLIADLAKNPNFKDTMLDVTDVADEIVKHIVSGKSGHLIMPKDANAVTGIRGWPSWLQYPLRDFFASKSAEIQHFGTGKFSGTA